MKAPLLSHLLNESSKHDVFHELKESFKNRKLNESPKYCTQSHLKLPNSNRHSNVTYVLRSVVRSTSPSLTTSTSHLQIICITNSTSYSDITHKLKDSSQCPVCVEKLRTKPLSVSHRLNESSECNMYHELNEPSKQPQSRRVV